MATSFNTSSAVIERLSTNGSAVSTTISAQISTSHSPTATLAHDTKIITQSPKITDNDTGSTIPAIILPSKTSHADSTSQGDMTGSRFGFPTVSSTSYNIVTHNPNEKTEGTTLAVVIAISTFALLIIFLVSILVIIIIKCRSKVKNKNNNHFELENLKELYSNQIQNNDHRDAVEIVNQTNTRNWIAPPHSVAAGTGIYSEVSQNNDHRDAIEIGNPAYMSNRTAPHPPPSVAAGTGIYSEVIIDTTGETMTKMTASDGQVLYNLVAPLTPPIRSASEIIESAAYACIQVNSDETPDTPGELDHTGGGKQKAQPAAYACIQVNSDKTPDTPGEVDHTRDGKRKAQPQRQSSVQRTDTVLGDATEGETVERPRMYTDIKIREVPAVPTKSSDLQEYLDTESALNISIYSESINPSDFTRNRMKGGGNDPQYLGPIYTVASSLPEIYQDPAEVTSENITEKTKLGTGQFGEVVLAKTNGLSLKSMGLSKTDNNPNVSVTVAVKKLQSNPTQAQREAFEKEAQFMSHIKHPNVLRLLGVCVHDSAFIMMEYTEGGDLNQFLQSYSEIVTTSSSQITSSELVYIASQIASGMQYLASLKFVHRDLATRNCFVTTNNSIKVGDVGVNTSLYQSSYYRIRGNRMMPIRWMATECFDGKFSEKSDVWAFGVTMWEMFTLAKQLPYRHLSDEEVIHNALKREYRQFPVKPVACPQPVYDVMEKCWAVDMRHRPIFHEIITMLQF